VTINDLKAIESPRAKLALILSGEPSRGVTATRWNVQPLPCG
jgi:hypothetical protein